MNDEGGRGLRLRLFGFPVHVDISFVIIMGLLGYLSGADSIRRVLTWIIVAALAVLIHELGHAVVARTTGARPAIALTGFGGLTTYVPPRPLSRLRSLSIAVAGPLTGLVAAALLVLVRNTVGANLQPAGLGDDILRIGIFTTEWWSVLNLLPVLPLDGGQAMRELLPGNPAVRTRRAAVVSLVVLVPLAALAAYTQNTWGLAMAVLLGLANFQALRVPAQAPSPGAPAAGPAGGPVGGPIGPIRGPVGGPPAPEGRSDQGPGTVAPEQFVTGLLWQGEVQQARQVLGSLPPGTPVDLAVHGAVLAVTGQPDQGFALLAQEVNRRPGDANPVALLVLAHILRRDWPAIEAILTAPLGASVPLALVERALREATAAGCPDVVARLSALPLRPRA